MEESNLEWFKRQEMEILSGGDKEYMPLIDAWNNACDAMDYDAIDRAETALKAYGAWEDEKGYWRSPNDKRGGILTDFM